MFPRQQLTWVNKTVKSDILNKRMFDTRTLGDYTSGTVVLVDDGKYAFVQLSSRSITRTRLSPWGITPRFALRVPGGMSPKWINIAALGRLRFF